jgi:hypothetical protein
MENIIHIEVSLYSNKFAAALFACGHGFSGKKTASEFCSDRFAGIESGDANFFEN